MKRLAWIGVAVLVLAGLGAVVWRLTRERDAIYDDKKAITDLLAKDDVPADVTLPKCPGACTDQGPLDPKHVTVVLSKKELRVPANGLVMPIPADASHGFGALDKRDGPNGLFVTKLGDTFAWVRQQLGATSLAIEADEGTPYRLLIEVLYTAGQSELSRFFLAERGADGAVAWVHSDPPKAGESGPCAPRVLGEPRPPESPHLCPTVLVVTDGFSVKARGGNIAPGCHDTGPGITLPKLANGAYDSPGLRECLERLKGASPDYAEETQVTVAADAAATLGAVLGAVDAALPVFPDVRFGVAR